LNPFAEYRAFVARVDARCRRVQRRHAEQIACRKGCPGNCCRIHLSLFPVEAFSLAAAAAALPEEPRDRIRRRALRTGSFGPCPLIEEGACRLYDARLVICRTHGLPLATRYRGRRSEGCCALNFRLRQPFPEDAVIDLDPINRELREVNRRFVAEVSGRMPLPERFTLAQALLIGEEALTGAGHFSR
jgi:Fe-S-cluster containining protein